MLVWLASIWVTISAAYHLYPHYLIPTFPVIFGVQALALSDLVSAVRRVRKPATIGAIAVLVGVVIVYTAFTLSFQKFLDDLGGTAGDYGVVYRSKAQLANVLHARGLRVGNEPVIDSLVSGKLDAPVDDAQVVTVRDSFHDDQPLECTGELRFFGVLSACLPPP